MGGGIVFTMSAEDSPHNLTPVPPRRRPGQPHAERMSEFESPCGSRRIVAAYFDITIHPQEHP
jgi:hypothetical protein